MSNLFQDVKHHFVKQECVLACLLSFVLRSTRLAACKLFWICQQLDVASWWLSFHFCFMLNSKEWLVCSKLLEMFRRLVFCFFLLVRTVLSVRHELGKCCTWFHVQLNLSLHFVSLEKFLISINQQSLLAWTNWPHFHHLLFGWEFFFHSLWQTFCIDWNTDLFFLFVPSLIVLVFQFPRKMIVCSHVMMHHHGRKC